MSEYPAEKLPFTESIDVMNWLKCIKSSVSELNTNEHIKLQNEVFPIAGAHVLRIWLKLPESKWKNLVTWCAVRFGELVSSEGNIT